MNLIWVIIGFIFVVTVCWALSPKGQYESPFEKDEEEDEDEITNF